MKITLELDLSTDSYQLTEDLRNFAGVLRSVLSEHKRQHNIEVPTVSIRGGTKSEKESKSAEARKAYKVFSDTLLDYHVNRLPNAIAVEQVQSIKKLFELGKTAEECIAIYDQSVQGYVNTSWRTVVYRINKGEVQAPEVKVLSKEEKQAIKDRLKRNDY